MLKRTYLVLLLVIFLHCLVVSVQAQGVPSSGSNATGSESDHHDEHDEHDHGDESKTTMMKAVSIAVIGALALIISAVVVFVPHFHANPRVMSLMSSFAAGVFILVGLCHMIPEGVEAVSESVTEEVNDRFRPGFMTSLFGYFFMIFVQRGIFKVEHTHQLESVEKVEEAVATAIATSAAAGANEEGVLVSPNEPLKPADIAILVDVSPSSSPAPETQQTQRTSPPSQEDEIPLVTVATPTNQPHTHGHADEHHHRGHSHGHGAASESDGESSGHGHSHGHSHGSHGHGHGQQLRTPKHRINMIALLCVFLIHGLADGIAIGIQKDFQGTLVLFIAVIAHHWAHDMVFAFETGKALESRLCRMILCAVQSLNTSVGVGIGWALQSSLPSVAQGYITCFCGGTFLMIGMTDLVPEEMMVGRRNLPQLLAFLIGAGTMYGVLAGAWTAAAHDH